MKETKAAFRNAVGGFNKQDVNDYIANLCENYENEKNSYTSQISELREKLEGYKSRCDVSVADTDEINRLKNDLEHANAVVAAQSEKLEEQSLQLESLRAKLAAKDAELESANEKLSLYADTDEKLQKYYQMSAKVGELILDAASSADKIKADAKIRADEMIREAEERARHMSEREAEISRLLEERYKSAVNAVNEKLAELAAKGMDSVAASLKAAEDEIEVVLERRRAAARAAITQTGEKLPELERLAVISAEI